MSMVDDHFEYVKEYKKSGIKTFAPFQDERRVVKLGGFTIQAFLVVHNVECYGFYITHKDMGKLIFVTDTSYVKQNFSKLKVNHILCEANYSKELLNKDEVKSNHVLTGHMCIDTACDFIRANDSSQLRNVVLLHLSQGNADRDMFLEKAQGITKSNVYIAERGLTVDLSEVPF